MILRYLLSPKILFFYLKNRFKYSSAPGEKSYGGDLGNVLEACYQETAIRNADICQIGHYIIRGKGHEGCPSFRCQKC